MRARSGLAGRPVYRCRRRSGDQSSGAHLPPRRKGVRRAAYRVSRADLAHFRSSRLCIPVSSVSRCTELRAGFSRRSYRPSDSVVFAPAILNARCDGADSATSVVLNVGSATPAEVRLQLRPFALVVSVTTPSANWPPFCQSIHRSRTVWVIDDASSDETASLLDSAGVRCIRSARNQHKPGALKTLMAALPP